MAQQHRSLLYVPGNQPDRIEKAYRTEADAVVIDLEDAVPQQEKERARKQAAEVLRKPLPKPTYVRINAVFTGLAAADVAELAGVELTGVWLPKAERTEDVLRVVNWLFSIGSPAGLHLLIESALGLTRLRELIACSTRVDAVSLGEVDLGADLCVTAESTLDKARAQCVIEARAAGLTSPVQSVYTAIKNLDGLRQDTQRGRAAGFFGRAALHPSQLSVINDTFTPTRTELANARELVSCLERTTAEGRGGAVTPDGHFVDAAVVRWARDLIALAEEVGINQEGSRP
jgi:citrate lyase subunit beta/citryl-CoA lyase